MSLRECWSAVGRRSVKGLMKVTPAQHRPRQHFLARPDRRFRSRPPRAIVPEQERYHLDSFWGRLPGNRMNLDRRVHLPHRYRSLLCMKRQKFPTPRGPYPWPVERIRGSRRLPPRASPRDRPARTTRASFLSSCASSVTLRNYNLLQKDLIYTITKVRKRPKESLGQSGKPERISFAWG